jgi:hypothetical protein
VESLAQRFRRGRRKGTFLSRWDIKLGAFCVALVLFTSAPIWGVQYFINQDGSGHVHSAWLMLEMVRGNPQVAELHQFNLLTYPNVAGHWLLAFFLVFTSAFTATKLMVSFTYVGLIAAAGWLRWCTDGRNGLWMSVLLAAALGFNWFWLQGAYNFILGLSLAMAGVGCYFRWRDDLNTGRMIALASLLVLSFLCHIISFAIFGLAVTAICILPVSAFSARSAIRTGITFVPAALLFAIYFLNSEASGELAPVWRSISDPLSAAQWVDQFRSVDPLNLMRRTAVPFVETESHYFAIFAPLLWISIAAFLLIGSTLRREGVRRKLPFYFICIGLICVALFAPDELRFSSSTGGLFRERIFLSGLLFAVSLFDAEAIGRTAKITAAVALSFVIFFQTMAAWEFAIRGDNDAREFFAASSAIPEEASLVAVTIEEDPFRFMATPTSSINNYNGILRNATIWDNYEFGHYLFPLVYKEKRDQEFVRRMTIVNAYALKAPLPIAEQRLVDLESLLASEENKINTVVLWGSEPRIDAIVKRSFASEPVLVNGRVKLFRR